MTKTATVAPGDANPIFYDEPDLTGWRITIERPKKKPWCCTIGKTITFPNPHKALVSILRDPANKGSQPDCIVGAHMIVYGFDLAGTTRTSNGGYTWKCTDTTITLAPSEAS